TGSLHVGHGLDAGDRHADLRAGRRAVPRDEASVRERQGGAHGRNTAESLQMVMRHYQEPVLGMLVQGSAGGSASPACSSSMEMPSGVRIKAMRPSRGGRLIVTPWAIKALQVS